MGESRPEGRRLTRRQFLLASASAGTGLFVLSGCGANLSQRQEAAASAAAEGGARYTGPPVDLGFWNGFTGGDGPVMRQLVEQFNSEHDNIQVNMVTMQWADYYQKVPAAIAAGQGPDVGIMHVDFLGTNAARGIIIPLDEVAESMGLQESQFAASVWKAGVYNGKRYGIPLDTHPLGLYYNKSVMEQAGLDPDKPPQTRDEYMAALKELKGAGIQGSWIPTALFTAWQWFQSLLWQFGGALYNEDLTRATVDSDAGVDALSWMVDVIKEGYSPANVGQDGDVIAFQNGQNAFNWNGIWMINLFKTVPDLEWDVAPLPQIGTEKAAWANSHNFVIYSQGEQNANKLQASKVFIDWVSQHSLKWAGAGQVPARTSVRESEGFADLEWQTKLAEQLPYLHFAPAAPGLVEISESIIFSAVNSALLLQQDPKSALSEAANKATRFLERNQQKYGEV